MEETKTTVRLPDPLLDRVRSAASEDHRSVNSEIQHLLEQALDRRDQGYGC